MIKFVLSFILSLLILLPSCGMVFADTIDAVADHVQMETVSHAMDEMGHYDDSHSNHSSRSYDCCLSSSKGNQERNINSIFSIEPSLVVVDVPSNIYASVFIVESKRFFEKSYRKNDPPDPSEYISLIGSSVKHLN
ncbi:hypothetical protein HOO68_04865 [Candidatus Gracilibacteria bacterium]|nr:hypothetical protein [Candidatus Gracilibacteria bacterium]